MNNNPIYNSFVDPQLCLQLISVGLEISSTFCWKYENDGYKIISVAFDEDHYYKRAYANVDYVKVMNIFNAFQACDMEKLLPDFMLNKNNNEYELHCSSLFDFEVESGNRLPDVLAMAVLKGIQKRKIDVAYAVKLITITDDDSGKLKY